MSDKKAKGDHSLKKDAQMEIFSRTVTMKDISERAGVSIGTVDRALHNRGRISEETKRHILQIAEELKYQRNNFARALSVHNRVNILAIYPLEPVQYMNNFSRGFQSTLDKLSDYGLRLDILRPRTLEPTDFLESVKDVDIDKYDGILINAGGALVNPFINEAVRKRKLVATFNSDTPTSKRHFFCGEDHWAAGALSAELIAKMLRGRGTVKLFSGSFSVYALQQRTKGFTDTIESEYPDIRVIGNISHEDDKEHSMERAENFLFESSMPDAIFCNNAIGAYPICSILEKHKVHPYPIVVGYDDDKALEGMLHKGICTAMMYQNPKKQASTALDYMFHCLYDDQPIPTIEKCLIVPSIVMEKNIGICRL